jgi:hypothetical protein
MLRRRRGCILAAVIFAVTIAVTSACYSGLESLAPFPCAIDGTCPDGFICQDKSCNAATLGSPCVSDATCANIGQSCPGPEQTGVIECVAGVCAENCDLVCPAGETFPDNSGVCFLECGQGAACADGTSCSLTGICVGPPPSSFTPFASCDDVQTCGGWADIEACVNGTCSFSCTNSTCPAGQTCVIDAVTNEGCLIACNDGTSCPSGTVCSSDVCVSSGADGGS